MKQTKKELPTNSIGYYRIEYANGVVQHKHLIYDYVFDSHLLYIKMLDTIYTGKEREEKISECKKWFKDKSGEFFFTTASPLAGAIRTGVLITPFCNMKVKFEIIK